MKRRHLAVTALGAVGILALTAAAGYGQVINTTNDGYSVTFTPDDGNGTLTAAEFPQVQAQRLADALSNTNPATTGDPNGYHNGYAADGFHAPDFAGAGRQVFVLDCTTISGGCDSGSAPADRINMPAATYRNSSEMCLRQVEGHELFHHIQFGYMGGFGNWQTWGSDPVEGTARLMQDKIFSDLDNGAPGCADYLSEVDNYLSDPATTLWGRSYTTALFWNYLMEQLGNDRSEPGVGVDFIKKFWENVQAAGSNRDFLGTLRTTIGDFDNTETLEDMFDSFSIANYTKQMDVSAIPDALKYRYVDEQQPGATPYASVPVTNLGNIPPTAGPTAVSVQRYGAKYVQADIGDCTGVGGVVVNGDQAGIAMVSQSGDAVTRIDRAQTTHFVRAVLVRTKSTQAKRVTRLGLVLTGLSNPANLTYTFACGPYSIAIKNPDATQPAFVGPKNNAGRFIVRMSVQGPSELGTPSIEGLRAEDFNATIDGLDAPVLNGAYVGGEYWLTVRAPDLPSSAADLQDLTVSLGDQSTTQTNAVDYEVKHLDQMLTVDRSASMLDPSGAPKIESARNAASLYVDVARAADKLGVVSFSGDNSEPDDDATLNAMLSAMTPSNRANARAQIASLAAAGWTSIGDGLAKSADEYPVRGTPGAEKWIVLLSDGMENEAQRWADVRASILAAGIKVDTIALGPLSDQELLQRIAQDTGGHYYYVDVPSSATAIAPALARAMSVRPALGGTSLSSRLADVFFASNEDAADLQRFFDASGTMPAGSSSRSIALGESDMKNAVIAVNWPATTNVPDVSLVDPNGNAVVAGPGVEIDATTTNVVFHLDDMTRGTWTLKFDNPGAGLTFVAMAAGEEHQGAQMWVALGTAPNLKSRLPYDYRWGVPIPIVADLTDKAGPITGSDVVAHVTHPDGTTLALPLFDDGNHGDGLPDDGVYGNSYTRTTAYAIKGADDLTAKPDGSYEVRVTADGTTNAGEPFRRIKDTAFSVYENNDPSPDTDHDGVPDLYEELHAQCMKPTDPGDVSLDPDNDGIKTYDEWLIGTDPCRPDTDRGGEPDKSEIDRGANPFDPRDDALPRPEDPSIVSQPIDHLGWPALRSRTLLIRYPANPAYDKIRLWRSTSAAGPYTIVTNFDSTAHGGLYRDRGLTNGQKYYYRIQGVDFAGDPSTMSPVFSGKPKRHPFPPIGDVFIDGSQTFTSSPTVTLTLRASELGTTTPVTAMMVSNNGSFAGASWEPFATTKTWTLDPDSNGLAPVYVKFRDQWGNVSNPATDDITVESGLITLHGRVSPDVAPADGTLDGIYVWIVGNKAEPIARTGLSGRFTFPALPPGSYKVRASGAGYATTSAVTLHQGVVTIVPVSCAGTC